jgi:hypothetical protein
VLEVIDRERGRASGVVRAANLATAGHHVQQHATARDTSTRPVVNRIPAVGHIVLSGTVVERIRTITNVAERIPLARTLQCEVLQEVIEEEATALMHDRVLRYLPSPLLVSERGDGRVERK